MIIVVKIDTTTRVQIPDDTISTLQSANNIGKGMIPIILPLTMDKYRADSWYGNRYWRRKTELRN